MAVSTEAGWRCFHCGDVFTEAADARRHFGGDETADAACQIKARDGGLLGALRRAETEIHLWRERALLAEEDAEVAAGLRAEIARYFRGARDLWEAFCHLETAEGRALAAEEQLAAESQRIDRLESLVRNEPHGFSTELCFVHDEDDHPIQCFVIDRPGKVQPWSRAADLRAAIDALPAEAFAVAGDEARDA